MNIAGNSRSLWDNGRSRNDTENEKWLFILINNRNLLCLYWHSVAPLHHSIQLEKMKQKSTKTLYKHQVPLHFTFVCLNSLGFNNCNLKHVICIAMRKKCLQLKIRRHSSVHTQWHSTRSSLWVWIKLILIPYQCTVVLLGRSYSFKNSFISLNVHWRNVQKGDCSLYSIISTTNNYFFKRERKRDDNDFGKRFLYFFSFLSKHLAINYDLCVEWGDWSILMTLSDGSQSSS